MFIWDLIFYLILFQQHLPNIKVHAYFAPVTPPPVTTGQRPRYCRCCEILWDSAIGFARKLLCKGPTDWWYIFASIILIILTIIIASLMLLYVFTAIYKFTIWVWNNHHQSKLHPLPPPPHSQQARMLFTLQFILQMCLFPFGIKRNFHCIHCDAMRFKGWWWWWWAPPCIHLSIAKKLIILIKQKIIIRKNTNICY